MKNGVLGLLALLCLVSTFAKAESCDRATMVKYAKVYRFADLNHDSIVTSEEREKAGTSLIQCLNKHGAVNGVLGKPYDLNGDGWFSSSDINYMNNVAMGYTGPCNVRDVHAFVALDSDQNGYISNQENFDMQMAISQKAGRMYSYLLDLNYDGQVSYSGSSYGDIGVSDRLWNRYR